MRVRVRMLVLRGSPRAGPEQPQRAVVRGAASVRMAPERAERCEVDPRRTERGALAEDVLQARRGHVREARVGEGEPVRAEDGRRLARVAGGRRRAGGEAHGARLQGRAPGGRARAVRERGGHRLVAAAAERGGRRAGGVDVVLGVRISVRVRVAGGEEGHAGRDGRGGVLVDGFGEGWSGGVVVGVRDHRERVAGRERRWRAPGCGERGEGYGRQLGRRRRIRVVEGFIGVATHRRLQLGGD
ncbi:uncharacterized protein B0H18DRAFT_1025571 [Fomitopsis serialis]|uniref:uncharacterized protein n=1 Tax=Fomitopsis serialis TaxID=139415 RepID=UPI002008A192|nr:uncharacterized protein B0H18DRAFT_1025571 [Neoantrodia serialis]KAH9920170.1 hypothetical protein B0H18DRAFT_1025571 [Neoantrodia serialis]